MRPGQDSYLADCRAINGGKISKFGIISLLKNSVRICPHEERKKSLGLQVWSASFYRAAQRGYTARINPNRTVSILDRDGKQVEVLTSMDMAVLDCVLGITQEVVDKLGFLHLTFSKRSRAWLRRQVEDSRRKSERGLAEALQGKRPYYFDNSPFVRVEQRRRGQTLAVLKMNNGGYRVFTPGGKREVPCEVLHPLAENNWEREPDYSFR